MKGFIFATIEVNNNNNPIPNPTPTNENNYRIQHTANVPAMIDSPKDTTVIYYPAHSVDLWSTLNLKHYYGIGIPPTVDEIPNNCERMSAQVYNAETC